jgi:hypothetical protein
MPTLHDRKNILEGASIIKPLDGTLLILDNLNKSLIQIESMLPIADSQMHDETGKYYKTQIPYVFLDNHEHWRECVYHYRNLINVISKYSSSVNIDMAIPVDNMRPLSIEILHQGAQDSYNTAWNGYDKISNDGFFKWYYSRISHFLSTK